MKKKPTANGASIWTIEETVVNKPPPPFVKMPKGQSYSNKYMKKRHPQLLEGKRYFSSNI
jgi:hypothetical protein